MDLANWQKQFWQTLHKPTAKNMQELRLISDFSQLPNRLSIYRNSMHTSLLRTLQKIYPASQRLVGEEFFALLADNYIKSNPSRSANLNHYGKAFSTFCVKSDLLVNIPYFADLAALEWQWHQLFYTPSNTPVPYADMHKLLSNKGEKVSLSLAKGARLYTSAYAIDLIWQACQSEYRGNFDFNLETRVYLILRQMQAKIIIERLTLDEWEFLNALRNQTLMEICTLYENQNKPEIPAELLPNLLKKQLIYLT